MYTVCRFLITFAAKWIHQGKKFVAFFIRLPKTIIPDSRQGPAGLSDYYGLIPAKRDIASKMRQDL